ncbi:DUF4381 domain-containing protein [Colwellia sp. 12G3]|uniref:DUF4381 domain-containing protein n=1 Tax=Colwellia sp. 12G3 TaxID=2058299 RepID=UPI000C32F809|nr:DUF4381 domain-containing protein [Colwellia sp. 12G3]PKI17557.1 DUF4381 domain-containing protein [Colwellia sp. 12G3]
MSFEKPWGNYLLEAIVETKAPETISFWPQTIGWQLLFILLTMLIIKKAYQSYKTYQANAYRREALAWLSQCSLSNEDDIRQLPALLRKTALIANEVCCHNGSNAKGYTAVNKRRQYITGLTGKTWVTWLDNNCGKSQFSQIQNSLSYSPFSCSNLLAQLAYIPQLDLNDSKFNGAVKQLYQQISLWIQYHQLNDESLQHDLGEQT